MPTVIDPTLTPSWLAVYEVIRQHWIRHGYAPSQSDVMRAIGCSQLTVRNAYKQLTRQGHVVWQKHESRAIKPVDLHRKIYKVEPDPWATLGEKEAWEA